MATITITEILGSDNLAGSRITLNNNFKTLQNAVNTLEQRLNTSFVPGGSLNVGDALIKKYTRPTTQIIFVVEASGQVQGDFYVVGATNTTGSVTVGKDITVKGNVTFDNSATPTPGTYTLTNALRQFDNNGYANEQYWTANVNSPVVNLNALLPAVTPVRNLDLTSFWNRRVIHIDLTSFTGIATDCTTVILPIVTAPTVEWGQLLTVVIDVPATSVTGGIDTIYIDPTNLDPAYTLPIPLNFDGVTLVPLTSADIKKTSITFVASITGWKVVHAHHYVDIATY